ncbi:hypothetical protein BDR06DRAFT_972559 [Suillus hirtellus]|nr:hypothetical protein BDR06DRAFT_972559 [Suillus hirtellus]
MQYLSSREHCIKPVIESATPSSINPYHLCPKYCIEPVNGSTIFKYLSTASSQLTVTIPEIYLNLIPFKVIWNLLVLTNPTFTPPPTNNHIINCWYLSEPLTVEDNSGMYTIFFKRQLPRYPPSAQISTNDFEKEADHQLQLLRFICQYTNEEAHRLNTWINTWDGPVLQFNWSPAARSLMLCTDLRSS